MRSSLQSYDKVFATRFHCSIKRKRGKFDKLKVRLVIQGHEFSVEIFHEVADVDGLWAEVVYAHFLDLREGLHARVSPMHVRFLRKFD